MGFVGGFLLFWGALTLGLRWGLREGRGDGNTYGPPKPWTDCARWALFGTVAAFIIANFVNAVGGR